VPIPKPKSDEKQDTFIARCMSNDTMKEEYPDNKQRLAICFDSWRKKKGGKKPDTKSGEKVMEIRTFAVDELRADTDEYNEPRIDGHAAVFNKWAQVGSFMERVRPGSFEETIKQDDVRALFNHDPNYVLGRKSSGTLELEEDKKGLAVSMAPPGTQWASDLMVSINRGDISQMSFGFKVAEEKWETKEIDGEPMDHRTITKVKLFDVSPVTFPAYTQTDVSIRSITDVAAEGRRIIEETRETEKLEVPVQEDGSDADQKAQERLKEAYAQRNSMLRDKQLRDVK